MEVKPFKKDTNSIVPEEQTSRPESSGENIDTFEALVKHVGEIVKFSDDNGKTWKYAKLLNPEIYQGQPRIHANVEISSEDVHGGRSFDPYNFKEFQFMTATPEEIKGKKFSYDFPEKAL
ncbi:MAG: hypothetical protein Q7R94_02355 [bacterium]|nr:hypothetical protein [bacterium]